MYVAVAPLELRLAGFKLGILLLKPAACRGCTIRASVRGLPAGMYVAVAPLELLLVGFSWAIWSGCTTEYTAEASASRAFRWAAPWFTRPSSSGPSARESTQSTTRAKKVRKHKRDAVSVNANAFTARL